MTVVGCWMVLKMIHVPTWLQFNIQLHLHCCCIPWVLLLWFEKHLRGATMQKSLTNLPYLGEKSWPYCWWKTSCTTWDVANLVNSRINYQPQLVSLPDFWTIFPVGLWWWDRKAWWFSSHLGTPPRNGSDCKGIRRGDGNTACISVFWYPYQVFNLASIICSFSTYIMIIYMFLQAKEIWENIYIFIKYQNHSKPTKHRWIFNLPWIPTGIGLPSAAKIRCHSRPKESGKESRGTLAKLGNMPRVVSPRHFTGNWALAAGCGW